MGDEVTKPAPLGPGVHQGLSMAEYLKLPAISQSLLRACVDECPAAAYYQSWLCPDRVPESEDESVSEEQKKRMGRGTIAHSVLLERSEACCEEIDPALYPAKTTGAIPDGWTNNAIRGARDLARARGKVPVLKNDMAEIRKMVASANAYIDGLKGGPSHEVWEAFQPDGGSSEVTMLWQEGDHLARLRADRISRDARVIVDAKFTATSVEPGAFGRSQMLRMGYYVAASWYRRGVRALCDVDCSYYFLAVEITPPYLVSLIGVDPQWLELGDSKVESGLRIWDKCKRAGIWPAYPNRAAYPELPAWAIAQAQEQEIAAGFAYDPAKLFQKETAA